jgi:hypothetical protein
LVTDSVKRADGIREIRSLDVFEVSATPTPMNNATRVLSTKAIDEYDRVRIQERDRMLALFAAVDQKALELDRKRTAPIQVATFEV